MATHGKPAHMSAIRHFFSYYRDSRVKIDFFESSSEGTALSSNSNAKESKTQEISS